MKARSLVSVLIVIAVGIGAPLMMARLSPQSAAAGRKGKAALKEKPAPAAPANAGKKAKHPPEEEVASPAASEQGPLSTAVVPESQVVLRITFRPKAVEGEGIVGTDWQGGITLSDGQVASLVSLKEDPLNHVEGSRWFLQNIRKFPQGRTERAKGQANMPFTDTGVTACLLGASPSTRVDVKTAQGDFSFQLADVPLGAPKSFLKKLATVERLPNSAIVLSAPTEDDFPAAAFSPDGALYVAYVSFTPGKDFPVHTNLDDEKDMAKLAEPTGGDQVFLMRLEGGKWSDPMPVTPPNGDVFRPALAIDGTGRAWVFWTAKADNQWELFARSLKDGQWSEPLRLTNSAGPDVMPAATRDADGRVWVAWQAFQTNNSDILAMRQEGVKFGEPMVVSAERGNQWTPSIAADKSGDVAVAWDTYAKGDYDVYARVWSKSTGQFGEPIPVATTLRAEMRPTTAYDAVGRLWIAYEDSPEKWGKDWGGLKKEGVKLYLARRVAVRVWAGGQLYEPAGDPNAAFLSASAVKTDASKLTGVDTEKLATAKEKLAEARRAETAGGPSVAAPRLTVDASGRVWLAVRGPGSGRTNVGTVWNELLSYYDGGVWKSSIFCPNTDNLLDNRPALAPRPTGGVVLVTSTDGRSATLGRESANLLSQLKKETGKDLKPVRPTSKWTDPNNLELSMVEIDDPGAKTPGEVQLKPVAPAPAVPSSPAEIKEAEDIARVRAEKVVVAGKPVSIVRGDFHRHTEISGDGGGDGMLMDMWRYALDAASMDWIGNGDHDNGGGREYYWWLTQKTTDIYTVPGAFTPMFTYERSVSYPDGHRNVVWAKRGIRTLPREKGGLGKVMDDDLFAPRPQSPDTERLYRYLRYFDGVCASHTSATDMGTDWRDNDPEREPMVEIYQGCRQNYEMPGAPRSNTADFSAGGWRPMGFVSLALAKGFKFGFESSSDHGSVHISYCNVWTESPTREAILEGMKRRHTYGSTTNIIAECFCGDHFMGDEFSMTGKPTFKIHIVGDGPLAKVHVIKDGKYAYTTQPQKQDVRLEWTDADAKPGNTSYYYVRGEQADGELVWISPMWITFQ